MSLINKMLQDLDARGGAGAGEGLQSSVRPVGREERKPRWPVMVAAATAAVLGVGAVFGWRYFMQPKPVAVVAPAPVRQVVMAPALAPPAAPAVAPAVAATPAVAPVPAPVTPAPAPVAAPVVAASVAEPAAPEPEVVRVVKPKRSTKVDVDKPAKMTRKEKRAEKARLAALKKSEAAPATRKARAAVESSPAASAAPLKPNAEGAYRRALGSLQEGRVAEAIATLEDLLQQDPRHEAARQTLIGLLIENRRPDEAIRHLRLGLGLEPRQPSMAMLLARLQIERGGSGIDTLQRSLPYAGGNSEYHAFFAGALQRQQRHREAAEQYELALRGAPQNGVWLMGLGISLQAEKRNAEAIAAFQKAKASNKLSPDLQAFVDRKLQQLDR
ncbi:MAG: tetratricopeptide repeat protein [Massilia sp.]